ncbi:hypothetical protein IMSAGC006_02201 [Muribaculaceae bacterium]|jgi:hypothetical protein|nr:hypothetical protein IMSAGC006_02201 [Muribaculaceae bacterium]
MFAVMNMRDVRFTRAERTGVFVLAAVAMAGSAVLWLRDGVAAADAAVESVQTDSLEVAETAADSVVAAGKTDVWRLPLDEEF